MIVVGHDDANERRRGVGFHGCNLEISLKEERFNLALQPMYLFIVKSLAGRIDAIKRTAYAHAHLYFRKGLFFILTKSVAVRAPSHRDDVQILPTADLGVRLPSGLIHDSTRWSLLLFNALLADRSV